MIDTFFILDLVKVLASYLLGSLIGSLIVGKLRGGVDIRTLGSGNAGGTNALRTQGKWFALWVMVIDVGKGIVAVRLIARFGHFSPWLPVVCGLAVIIGHVYPIWFGFRGGKGVATLVGVVFALSAQLLVVVLLVWLVMVMLFGYVSLASIVATLSIAVWVGVAQPEPFWLLLLFGAASALLIAFTHRSNLARISAGTEPRARRLWLLGRRRVS